MTIPISALSSGQVVGLTDGQYKITSAHGAIYKVLTNEELLSLSTGGTTTNFTMTVPQYARLIMAGYRVTTTITTAVSYQIQVDGNPTTDVALNDSTITNLTAGQTGILSVPSGFAPVAAAQTIRIVANTTPGAGAIRLFIVYEQLTAPTS